MPFAQINYSQKVGNSSLSISEIGCLLTAFSNLLERYGEPVDPPTLNNDFNNKHTYILAPEDGPNVSDDLAWGSISAHDGQVAVVGIGGAGWPDSNDAVVKFVYKSPRSGHQVTHFSLVADCHAGTIIDSWDGITKRSPYGTPVAWAKYERHVPQVVYAPAPITTPSFTIEDIPERTEELKIDAKLWDMNQRTWSALVNNPVGSAGRGTKFPTTQIAHHLVGGSYYLLKGSGTQGYNIVDCQDPTPDAPPAPVVVEAAAPRIYNENTIEGIKFEALASGPKQFWVSKQGGTEKWSFKNVKTWRGFTSVAHLDYGTELFLAGVAHHPIPPKGADYYMINDDFGNFKQTGQPANFYGFNWADISDRRPPALPAAPVQATKITAPLSTVTPIAPAPALEVAQAEADKLAAHDWREDYRPFPNMVKYIAVKDISVADISRPDAPSMLLPKYDPNGSTSHVGIIGIYGTITKDGVDYYRAKLDNDTAFAWWYCVPKLDPVTRTPLLLVKPGIVGKPVSKVTVARDRVQLAKSSLELDASKFLDDIIPKWLKIKK